MGSSKTPGYGSGANTKKLLLVYWKGKKQVHPPRGTGPQALPVPSAPHCSQDSKQQLPARQRLRKEKRPLGKPRAASEPGPGFPGRAATLPGREGRPARRQGGSAAASERRRLCSAGRDAPSPLPLSPPSPVVQAERRARPRQQVEADVGLGAERGPEQLLRGGLQRQREGRRAGAQALPQRARRDAVQPLQGHLVQQRPQRLHPAAASGRARRGAARRK